ncbi:MAG: ROK family protein [Gammaproteobacteria bacterium]
MRIGVDLGGSKIEAIALDHVGETLTRRRVDTPESDYTGIVGAVTNLVLQLEIETGRAGSVGVGLPGAVAPGTGLIKNANSVCLNGKPLQADLEAALQRPVRLANDADCFTLSEATDGAAAGAAVVFGVIVGTGTGGGVVVRGQLLTGPNAIAGEWGHNSLPWPQSEELPGPPCYCGKFGCIETFLSGPGLALDHETVTGEKLDAASIVALAEGRVEQGYLAAEATLQRYERRLAKALASVINLLDPDVIMLGGGLSNIERLYVAVPKLWGEYVFSAGVGSETVRTQLLPPKHGDSSGVRGAAWLWPVNSENK